MNLQLCRPLSGPIMLVPTDEDLQARRQWQTHDFGRLDALALSLSSEEEARLGFMIDVRN
ncbi:hypothetical protein EHF33_15895 [Deinococcus psychrotolerans]|uniref:Uncharacterized protein n=1 Tax=Deinococcus psychrotolerans TaxID=2489213 RepID=A0A3G8YH95_9DEIO|nr:hypothetical protein [Deinococcus psychrotolerans]AZI44363.1 hypothetical protein EHF33_15895 [Deinococcus psychrotolerans]